jgi:hypothetical protein
MVEIILDKEKNVNVVMEVTDFILKGNGTILHHSSEPEILKLYCLKGNGKILDQK